MNVHFVSYREVLDQAYGLILTANSIEKRAVEAVLGDTVAADVQRRCQGSKLGFVEPHILLHLTGRAGGTDEDAVGRLVRHMFSAPMPCPSFVVLVGIGWGNPAEVAIGDVMLANEVYSLNYRRATPNGPSYVRSQSRNVLRMPPSLPSMLAPNAHGGAVRYGPIASLETHFASDAERDALLDQYPDLIGGEMEAYGFLADCGHLPWVVLKGVSDFGGDLTDRASQEQAAANAAKLLPTLIRLLTHEVELPEPGHESPARQNLIEGIIGDTIVVTMPAKPELLNDYLNDDVGALLERRLARYGDDEASDDSLRRALTNFILEAMQNAFRHGRASTADISFYETKVVVSDDGAPFDLAQIQGDNGGALAWRAFRDGHVVHGHASVSYKRNEKSGRNLCTFKFETLSEELRAARERCTATIVPGMIRSGRPTGVLVYDPACEIIHVSTAGIRMFSRNLEIVESIIAELGKGKKVYVECGNNEDADHYRDWLKDHIGERLRIYVGSRVG